MKAIAYIRDRWASTLSVVLGLLLLAPTASHGAEFVLCIEDSGGVNVERAESGECSDFVRPNGEGQGIALGAPETKHCADCADVPLQIREANDPCGSAVILPSPGLEEPAEAETGALGSGTAVLTHVAAKSKDGRSSQSVFRSARPKPDPDTSLGSVILLI
ncbi:hypothetical protein GGQ07_000016 [Salinibacter ruber]|uniref:hypothetical protein n=1 Tax=Salinibacter ruber TaxID=146919 RepID=UPI00216851EC|nr:hypothetical protein [Salinibacter ruber]MCS4178604.1 hypothetical protein [Salinibacter ruber]